MPLTAGSSTRGSSNDGSFELGCLQGDADRQGLQQLPAMLLCYAPTPPTCVVRCRKLRCLAAISQVEQPHHAVLPACTTSNAGRAHCPQQVECSCLVVERAEQVWPAWLAGSGQSRVSSTKAAQRRMHTCCQVAPKWLYVEVHALVGAPALPLNAVHHACKEDRARRRKKGNQT